MHDPDPARASKRPLLRVLLNNGVTFPLAPGRAARLLVQARRNVRKHRQRVLRLRTLAHPPSLQTPEAFASAVFYKMKLRKRSPVK